MPGRQRRLTRRCGDTALRFERMKDTAQPASLRLAVMAPAVPPRTERGSRHGFTCDEMRDVYICPEGHELTKRGLSSDKTLKIYKMQGVSTCVNCQRFGKCTKDRKGRSTGRLVNEESRRRFEAAYKRAAGKRIYNLRKQKVELPFGHIKRNLGADYFVLRGKEKALGEISLLGMAFHGRRMITVLEGDGPLMKALGGMA